MFEEREDGRGKMEGGKVSRVKCSRRIKSGRRKKTA